jgi:hypothetical protein
MRFLAQIGQIFGWIGGEVCFWVANQQGDIMNNAIRRSGMEFKIVEEVRRLTSHSWRPGLVAVVRRRGPALVSLAGWTLWIIPL